MQGMRSLLGAIATDNDERINPVITNLIERRLESCRSRKFGASSGPEEGAAAFDDSADVASSKWNESSGYEAGIAVLDADHFKPTIEPGANDGTHRGIHAWRIAPACQNGNSCHALRRRSRSNHTSLTFAADSDFKPIFEARAR